MIEEVSIETLYAVFRQVPEMDGRTSLDEIRERIGEVYLAQIFREGDAIAGFKLGYALDERSFYSWIGGVLPEHRRRGVALSLLTSQEDWARAHQFESIRVKSKNRYPAMMCMLLNNGYIIEDFTAGEFPLDNKIHFYKHL